MPNRFWVGGAAGDTTNWHNPDNWSLTSSGAGGAGVPTFSDDVIFDIAGNAYSCASSSGAEVNTLTASGYTNNISFAGGTLTCSGNCYFDHTGTLHLGNAVTINGSSSVFHIGSIVGSLTTSACFLTSNASGVILDIDKSQFGLIFSRIKIGENATATIQGGSSSVETRRLDIKDNATFTQNITLFSVTNNVDSSGGYSMEETSTFNGTGASMDLTNYSANSYFPGFNFTGTTNIRIWPSYSAGITTFNQSGNITSKGDIEIEREVAADLGATYNTNGYSIETPKLSLGTNAYGPGDGLTINFGNSTINVGSVGKATLFGTTMTLNMETSTWNVSGNYRCHSENIIYDVGSSVVNIISTSGSTHEIDCNGQTPFYELNISTSGNDVQLFDDLTLATSGTLNVTEGSLNTSGYDVNVSNLSTSGTGTLDIGSGTLYCQNSGYVSFGSGPTYNTTSGLLVLEGDQSINIDGNLSFSRLLSQVPGQTITWNTGSNVLGIDSYTTSDWSGSLGNLVTWLSSSPGTQYRIDAPPNASPSYLSVTDCRNIDGSNIVNAADGTNTNGGNNVNWNFGNIPVPSSICYFDSYVSSKPDYTGSYISSAPSTTGAYVSSSPTGTGAYVSSKPTYTGSYLTSKLTTSYSFVSSKPLCKPWTLR